MIIVLLAAVASAQREHPHRVFVVMNPFQPLAVYDPPCSFDLLHFSPQDCKPGNVIDHFGLCAKCEWDCEMGNGIAAVDYFYENFMPSRAFECQCYCTPFMSPEMRAKRGHGSEQDRSPRGACAHTFVVDDELEQTINVLQSVNMKTEHYIAVEVGSRQGQWGFKAAQLARHSKMGYKSVHVRSIELMPEWKASQEQKLSMNKLDDVVSIMPTLITEQNFPQLVHNLTMRSGAWQPINTMDWDCQGCERLLASAEAHKLFEDHILSLFIAVHGNNYKYLAPWYKKYALVDTGVGVKYKCDVANRKALFENRGAAPAEMADEMGHGCLTDSPFGPIYYRDGTLRLFNRNLYDKLGLESRLPNCKPWGLG